MGLAALRPELPGPLLLAGSPLSYWAGAPGLNPMRYTGGLLGGSWLSHLSSDLGNGRFDGANLVLNFEQMNPANTWWSKYYNLLDNADTEPPRFLEFERWWGGYFLMNREEMTAIVDQLFVGNSDDITPPQQALNWILDIYASDDDLLAQGQAIVYSVHPKVEHLGIFVSGAVARKEHAGFVELLDLIEALPPSLYEMLIEDKRPDMRGAQLVPDPYVTRFERRSVADIAALCGDRSGERPFEVVRRISEVNTGLYEQLVAPVVRSFANEPAAAASRQLHPLRAQRWALSDLNPMLLPFAVAASVVKDNRQPCAADNPFRMLEREVASAVEQGLQAFSDTRDKAAERMFEALYATPLARAAAGLANAPVSQPLGADPARRELARREAQELLAGAAQGTVREGIVRILLLLWTRPAPSTSGPIAPSRRCATSCRRGTARHPARCGRSPESKRYCSVRTARRQCAASLRSLRSQRTAPWPRRHCGRLRKPLARGST